MQDITEPLRLAVGSHSAGTGAGCVMNVISWENGDQQITDFPSCSDGYLARICQWVNDHLCDHTATAPLGKPILLCPECSQIVLELGHRTVGTADVDAPARGRAYRAMNKRLLGGCNTTKPDPLQISYMMYSNSVMFLEPGQDRRQIAVLAHELIDIFERETGVKAPTMDEAKVAEAYEKMVAVA